MDNPSENAVDFTSIDVETANPDLSSVCQVGVVQFRDGTIVHRWKSFVNPNDYFNPAQVSVHGIRKSDVTGAPTFPEIADQLRRYLISDVVCHHTAFDRRAVYAAHLRYELTPPDIQWLDTARVVRRTWPDRSRSGYGLQAVAKMLGIAFNHHDAEEDARAAGEILLHAVRISGFSVSEWLVRANRPMVPATRSSSSRRRRSYERHVRDGNPEGALFGESVVFTGSLSMTQREAADLAAKAGCDVSDSVTRSTTLLIVGDQDARKLAGHTKSGKHRKAESFIQQGQRIRILCESDFQMLLVHAENK